MRLSSISPSAAKYRVVYVCGFFFFSSFFFSWRGWGFARGGTWRVTSQWSGVRPHCLTSPHSPTKPTPPPSLPLPHSLTHQTTSLSFTPTPSLTHPLTHPPPHCFYASCSRSGHSCGSGEGSNIVILLHLPDNTPVVVVVVVGGGGTTDPSLLTPVTQSVVVVLVMLVFSFLSDYSRRLW